MIISGPNNYNTSLPINDPTTNINTNKVTEITGNTSNMYGGLGTNTGEGGIGNNKPEKKVNIHIQMTIYIYTNM